jgi:hypothetical protein
MLLRGVPLGDPQLQRSMMPVSISLADLTRYK